MADPLGRLRPGDPVPTSQRTWNALLSAARAHEAARLASGGGELETPRDAAIVRVKNETGAALPIRGVVGLAGPIFAPSQSEGAFLREVTFRGVVPTGDHRGKFGVLLEPAPPGRVVRAFVAGVVQARVSVADEAHACADAEPGNPTSLVTSDDGSAQILWLDDAAYGGDYGEGEEGPYGADRWAIVRLGATCGGVSGDGTSGRCDCPEEPYLVEVECGPCYEGDVYDGYGYGGEPVKMPRIWHLRITASAVLDPYGTPCQLDCESIPPGSLVKLYHGGGCGWTGRGAPCLEVELTAGEELVTLTIADRAGCVYAVLTMDAEAFDCCGTNSAWSVDPNSLCEISAVLAPDPCTCCPPPRECPPEGVPLCDGTTCCFSDGNCTITVTVADLYTPAALPCTMFADCVTSEGEPCSFGDPDCWIVPPGGGPGEDCGGMNGAYAMEWVGDCTWRFRGTPGGGSKAVRAVLRLAGETWRLEVDGPGGQRAVFEGDGCGPELTIPFVPGESTCPDDADPKPTASFTLAMPGF